MNRHNTGSELEDAKKCPSSGNNMSIVIIESEQDYISQILMGNNHDDVLTARIADIENIDNPTVNTFICNTENIDENCIDMEVTYNSEPCKKQQDTDVCSIKSCRVNNRSDAAQNVSWCDEVINSDLNRSVLSVKCGINGYNQIYDENTFNRFVNKQKCQAHMQDILLANHVTQSGVPNRYGCRIPVRSNWNLDLLQSLLQGYEDMEIIDWLCYGFSISRNDEWGDPIPANTNHLGATLFPDYIDAYIVKEIELDSTIRPFTVPPFMNRIGISPLSTRPKRNT